MPSILNSGDSLFNPSNVPPPRPDTVARVSPDGHTELRMMPTGNLVLRIVPTNRLLWQSGTTGQGITRATMEQTGELVLHGSRNFASNTRGNGNVRLVVRNDRTAVIARPNSNGSIWEAPPGILFPIPGLRLMSSVEDMHDIPTAGEDLIIVATVDNVLHFRIFDPDGKVVRDTDEKRLAEQARPIEDLRKQLESLWPPRELTWSERGCVITAVTSIVDHTPDRRFRA